MLALGLDTSRASGSIGLVDDAGRFPAREIPTPPVHSRKLLIALKSALEEAGAGPRDLDVVAVACGPGSFTGLRVGMATARGLSLAIRRPVAGFSTLETIAIACAATRDAEVAVTVLMDAGRGQVYRGAYLVAGEAASPRRPEAAVGIGEALSGIEEGLVTCDEGLMESEALGRRLRDIGAIAAPSIGATLARRGIALCRAAAGGAFPPLIPNYLRASDAEKTATT